MGKIQCGVHLKFHFVIKEKNLLISRTLSYELRNPTSEMTHTMFTYTHLTVSLTLSKRLLSRSKRNELSSVFKTKITRIFKTQVKNKMVKSYSVNMHIHILWLKFILTGVGLIVDVEKYHIHMGYDEKSQIWFGVCVRLRSLRP